MRDIASPLIRRIDVGPSPIQGPPHSPMVYRYERQDRQGATRDRDATGGKGRDQDRRAVSWGDDQRDNDRPRQHRGPVPDRPRQRRGPPRPDRNRRPYLADVQCAACKRVGHVAKLCDMLATAICLERCMKHDLNTSSRDSIEKDWLKRWTERLGNPDRTPRQVMRTYVEDLDITVCWGLYSYGMSMDRPYLKLELEAKRSLLRETISPLVFTHKFGERRIAIRILE